MDKATSLLRRAEAILFLSNDTDLRKFLENYYVVRSPGEDLGDYHPVLLYCDVLPADFTLLESVDCLWIKERVSQDQESRLKGQDWVDSLDIKEVYTAQFLGQCSV